VSLAGARVLVTRAAEEAAELEDLLRARGALPVSMPCIAFEDGPDVARIGEAVRERPDLIVVSSPHGARRLLELVGPVDVPFAAVGAATGALLPGHVLVPEGGAGAEALLARLAPLVRGRRVLVPRAERGTPALVEGLERAGALVEALTLYRTVVPQSADPAVLRDLREGRIDAIAFTSGSGVRGFLALAGADAAARCAVVCMGGTAVGEAGAAGLRIDAASGPDLREMCDALALAVSGRRD
jgi:uroporphyrinogen III methyltransferase/synthase